MTSSLFQKYLLVGAVGLFLVASVAAVALNKISPVNKNQDIVYQQNQNINRTLNSQNTNAEPQQEQNFTVVADKLSIPWEFVSLPNGDMLMTYRPGTLELRGATQKTYTVEGVEHIGEGGLLGLALHPDFENNHFLYLYLTTRNNGAIINQVQRYKFENEELSDKKIILSDIPGAANHNGGRIAFGPDGYLYITTGDASRDTLAQDTNSLAGKILRIKDDGSFPDDNPFKNAVYSYGHRNSQGIAWDSKGRLWATEHGRSGVLSGYDEVNLVEKGKNYGWPTIEGDETQNGMETPMIHSGATTTWAPSQLVIKNDILYFVGLRGETLYSASIADRGKIELKTAFKGQFGRIRIIKLANDGGFYIGTSNTDGRGQKKENDDKIIKVSKDLF